MQVFKLYFKVLRKYIGTMIMYVGIFIGITLGVIVPQAVRNQEKNYTDEKCDFAVFDYDESILSKALTAYLETTHNLKVIKNDNKETIQDELYIMNIHSVIRINEGFEEAFKTGKVEEFLETYVIPGTITATLFEQNLNSYLSVVNTYIAAGFSVDEATKKADEVAKTSTEIIENDEKAKAESALSIYFKYASWVFIAMCVSGITVVLIALNKKELRNRIECSAYKFVKMNMEIVLGVVVTGVIICAVFVVAALIVFPEQMLEPKAVLYVLNALCIMAVALAITFFISKVTDKVPVISLMSNVIGLGMAFLCGVFVPMEFLSDTVIKVARFMPVYWNIKALQIIDGIQEGSVGTIFSYMGIQILFAVAILCIGMIIARRKRVTYS
ncbi:MAG: ABC transporter permease [Lachnospiraceae bacterium]|nr:ABC transporter permease [Lachnospiraceae bacterium]